MVRTSLNDIRVRGCGQQDCDVEQIEPVDLLCRTHGALLVFGGLDKHWRYLFGVFGCAFAWLAFFIGPELNNSAPGFVVLAAAGLVVVFLPLRLFPVAGRTVAVGWVIASAVAPVLDRPHGKAFQAVVTVVAVLLVAGWMAQLGREAAHMNKMADGAGGVSGAAFTAIGLGVAVTVAPLWLVAESARQSSVTFLYPGMTTPLAWITLLALGVAVGSSAAFAAVTCTAGWSGRDSEPIKPPRRPGRLTEWAARRRSVGSGRRPAVGFIDGLSLMTVGLILIVLDIVVYLVYYWVLRILIALANWLMLWTVQLLRISWRATKLFARCAWSAARVTVVPTIGLLVAALFLLNAAQADISYNKSAAISDAMMLAGYAGGAYLMLTLVWTALSALPPSRLSAAVSDFTASTIAITIVLILIGGLGFGLLGLAGIGQFRIGWLTAATVVLVVGVTTARGLWQRSASKETSGADSSVPDNAEIAATD